MPADAFPVDMTFADAFADDYNGAVIPGGVANADFLRMDNDAVELIHTLVPAGRPIAAICHGRRLLVEANVVRGKLFTSFPSLQADVRNSGGD